MSNFCALFSTVPRKKRNFYHLQNTLEIEQNPQLDVFFFFAFEQYIRNFASVPCGLDIRRYRYFCINVFVTIVRGQFKDLNGKWAT